MDIIKKGQVYWFDPEKTYGLEPRFTDKQNISRFTTLILKSRPYVVVSSTKNNNYKDTIVVCPITSKSRINSENDIKLRSTVETGLARSNKEFDSYVIVDQIRVIDKLALGAYICTLSELDINNINNAIERLFIKDEYVGNSKVQLTKSTLKEYENKESSNPTINIDNDKINEIISKSVEKAIGTVAKDFFKDCVSKIVDEKIKEILSTKNTSTKNDTKSKTRKKYSKRFNSLSKKEKFSMLKDIKSMSKEEFIKKYDISISTYNRLRNKDISSITA